MTGFKTVRLVLLFSLVFVALRTGAAPDGAPTLNNLFNAMDIFGRFGGAVNHINNVRGSLDPNRFVPYQPENNAARGSLQDTLQKIGGICCIMPNYCAPHAECSSKELSANPLDLVNAIPTCTCPKGFKGDGRDGRYGGTGCMNVDECVTGEAKCEQLCTDMSPGYMCGCRPGFTLASDGFSCNDIDECALGTAGCTQLCVNTPGSYRCECREGYSLGEDGRTCVDINECDLMKEIAAYNASIVRGESPPPLSPLAKKAKDTLLVCEYIELCLNFKGGYSCGCPLGYQINYTDPSHCADVNECAIGIMDQLNQTSRLPNPPTSLIIAPPPVCTSDIDKVAAVASQVCTNTIGSFECSCAPGFKASTTASLVPTKSHLPPLSAEAVNKNYLQDLHVALSLECQDINECQEAVDPCTGEVRYTTTTTLSTMMATPTITTTKTTTPIITSSDTAFTETTTSTTTTPGMTETDGTTTAETVTTISGTTHAFKITTETVIKGGVTTAMFPSEHLGAKTVAVSDSVHDMRQQVVSQLPDLHVASADHLHPFSTLPSVLGSSYAENGDDAGHQENLWTTERYIHSLSDLLHAKDKDDTVSDTRTKRQLETLEPFPKALTDDAASRHSSLQKRHVAQCVNLIGSYECRCPSGFEYSKNTRDCREIDQCRDSSLNLCVEEAGEQCRKIPGGYVCGCANGFRSISGNPTYSPSALSTSNITILNTSFCEDIDECAEGIDGCDYQCVNTYGSYECRCPTGYRTDPQNKTRCININECEYDLCPPKSACIDLPGTYICGCPKGKFPDPSRGFSLTQKQLVSSLSKETQRLLKVIGAHVDGRGEEFNKTRLKWDTPAWVAEKARIEADVFSTTICVSGNVCALLTTLLPGLCPVDAQCSQTPHDSFTCTCPSGYKLGVAHHDGAKEEETTLQNTPHAGASSSQGPARLPGGLGDLVGGLLSTLGLNLGARRLDATPVLDKPLDRDDVTMPNEAAAHNDWIPRPTEVLTLEEFLFGQKIGLVTTAKANVPLWVLTRLNWFDYAASGGAIAGAHCIDIDECKQGVDGSGDLRSVCPPRSECCESVPGTYHCHPKRMVGLRKACPASMIDMSQFMASP